MNRHENILFKVVERPVYWKDRSGEYHPSEHKALLRVGEDKKPIQLAVVGDGYKVVQNSEIMDVVQTAVKGWPTEIETYTDYNGRKCYIDVQFKDVSTALSGDPINFRAIFWNGHGASSFGAHVGTINHFCTNGMILGSKETTYKRHTKGLDPAVAHEWITNGLKTFEVYHKAWDRWLRSQVDQEKVEWAIGEMVEHDIQKIKLHTLYWDKYVPKYGPNLFSVHGVLTDYATHYDEYRLKAANSNSRNSRSFDLLRQAEHIINQMAA